MGSGWVVAHTNQRVNARVLGVFSSGPESPRRFRFSCVLVHTSSSFALIISRRLSRCFHAPVSCPMSPPLACHHAVRLLLCAVATAVVAVAAPCGNGVCAQPPQTECLGDTRYDRRCAHDATHRVCARIGDPQTSFFRHTGQRNWCGTVGNYGGAHGRKPRCPPDAPTWCVCKWAAASWVQHGGCDVGVEFDCNATDICATEQGLYFSYADYGRDLQPAHACVAKLCPAQWAACVAANVDVRVDEP